MKKSIFLLSVILLGILVTTIYSCELDPKETCSEDVICEEQTATACCDENNVCVYKYNGQEYTVDQLDQLEEDMGCPSVKSAGTEGDLTYVVARLKALMARVAGAN
jgi:hypothetical protein